MWKELITFAASSHPMKTFIILLVIWGVTGYGNFDGDKHQVIIPSHQLGVSSSTWMEDKRQDVIPYPRVGRTSWNLTEDKRQDVIPYPRVGRTSWNLTEDKRQGLVPFPRVGRSEEKHLQLTLIPRVGDYSLIQDTGLSVLSSDYENQNADYQTKNEIPISYGKYHNRKLRQVIPAPRFGRSFIPGIGRQNSVSPYSLFVQRGRDKRSFFTPRIVRTPFTPRLRQLDDNTGSNIVHTGY